jgi:hypothetical protein
MEYTDKDDITTYQAIKSLVGGELHTDLNGIIQYLGGQTPPTDAEIDAELKRLQAEYDAQEYARNRKTDYPDIGDQLDALYHAGVFPANMAARIKETKDKYPK